MSIQLLPEYCPGITGSRWAPLTTGPAYVRSSGATRWHRPRSGRRHDDGRISYAYWCGSNYGDLGVDEIDDTDDLCATCEGRFRAQHADNVWRFTPRKALPPTVCPASRSYIWVPARAIGRFDCEVCGADVTSRGSWHDMPRVSRHAPGPRLVDPCPLHGWYRLTRSRSGAVVCACAADGYGGAA